MHAASRIIVAHCAMLMLKTFQLGLVIFLFCSPLICLHGHLSSGCNRLQTRVTNYYFLEACSIAGCAESLLLQIATSLSLPAIRDRPWQIQPCCAKSGEGLKEGMEWLIKQLQ